VAHRDERRRGGKPEHRLLLESIFENQFRPECYKIGNIDFWPKYLCTLLSVLS
jgi:hypothetical protein